VQGGAGKCQGGDKYTERVVSCFIGGDNQNLIIKGKQNSLHFIYHLPGKNGEVKGSWGKCRM